MHDYFRAPKVFFLLKHRRHYERIYLQTEEQVLKALQVTRQGHSKERVAQLLDEKGDNVLQE